jgi:ABC-type glycerol-3-phosphate transport system permease component
LPCRAIRLDFSSLCNTCKAHLTISTKKLKKTKTMEINWGNTLVSLVTILICVVPFVIMYYSRTKKKNKMLQSLNEIAQQNNCKVSQHEFCGDFIFGIDENRNHVFFFKQKINDSVSQFVDLSTIQTCQADKKSRTFKNKNETVIKTDRIELSFLPKEKSRGETIFELYDEETNLQLSGELQFVDKWSKQINELLKTKNN